MTKQEILAKATKGDWQVGSKLPRPAESDFDEWEVVGASEHTGGRWIAHTQTEANAELIALAHNAYERDQQTIKALSEALTIAAEWLCSLRPEDEGVIHDFETDRKTIDAALATVPHD